MIYCINCNLLTTNGSSTVNIYTQTQKNTMETEYTEQNIHNNKNAQT
jgi:hypothetical protein